MSTPSTTRTAPTGRLLLVVGALLCLAVTYIHLADQGGYAPSQWFPGDTDPPYIKIGYYLLEAAGVLAAVLLFARSRLGWLLAAGVALGPLVGYLLTRTTGLPGATDDIGNWGSALGTVSLVVEAGLLLLAITRLPLGAVRGDDHCVEVVATVRAAGAQLVRSDRRCTDPADETARITTSTSSR